MGVWNHRVVAGLVLAGLYGCSASEPAQAPASVRVSARRAPLGVAGKPLVDSATGQVVADEILVRLAPGVGVDEVLGLVGAAGGTVVYRGPSTGVLVVRFASAEATAAARAWLIADPRVAEAAPQHVMQGHDASGTGIGTSPSIFLAGLQWNLWGLGLDPLGPRVGAAGVTVAVLDTGVAYEDYQDARGTYALAPDLAEVEFAAGWDFVNDDAHPNDDQRHGTHVTGVIAASAGIASIAPGATIMPVKVLDAENRGTELALAEGLRYAVDHGADVINLSLSFPPTYFPSRLLQDAIDHATRNGVTIVAAAGNHGEGIVAYPAAFRDVIAVGASDLPSWFWTFGQGPWRFVMPFLQRAAYSNHSYKLDVVAPAGSIPGDANFDGYPEAVLAQTFAPGEPTNFGYYFYAGTSQAAAQATAVIAVMRAQNAELGPDALRAVLGDAALPLSWAPLSASTGLGAMRYPQAVARAAQPQAQAVRARSLAGVTVTLHDRPSGPVARARVEIVDADGRPVPWARVYGLWSGAAFGAVSAWTGADGVAQFESPVLSGNLVAAFQVDGVARGDASARVDRPLGFVRIDSLSLARLSAFGKQLNVDVGDGIGTSPSGEPGDGIGTSPSGDPGASPSDAVGITSAGVADGTGIGTSPSGPVYELPTDPARTPLTVAFDPTLFAGTGYRPTLLLPSFSWGLATVPMAVAVDEAWFMATFPGAAARRVVSLGRGVGASPLRFDEASFPAPIDIGPPPEFEPLPLIVVTFSSGLGTSPSLPASGTTDPTGSGLGTSPSRPVIIDLTYGGGILAPNLVVPAEALFGAWVAFGAGLGTSPSLSDSRFAALGAGRFGDLSQAASRFAGFGAMPEAAPVAAYGLTLGAAALPMAPVSSGGGGSGGGSDGAGVAMCTVP
jgi:serine protease